jgi:hypothetical protein
MHISLARRGEKKVNLATKANERVTGAWFKHQEIANELLRLLVSRCPSMDGFVEGT